MSLLYRVKELASKKKVSLAEVERKSGLSSGTITKWDKSSPKAETLEKVAKYFDVTTDYLLGRTENPKQAGEKQSDDLDKVLDSVMSFDGKPLDEHDREVIRAYLKGRFGK